MRASPVVSGVGYLPSNLKELPSSALALYDAYAPGRILADEEEREERDWHVLSLPAIAETNESLPGWRRRQGEALWPARWPVDRLQKRRKHMRPFWWSAVYQQTPKPPEGNLFKRRWFRYYTTEPHGEETLYVLHGPEGQTKRFLASQCWRFQTCDPAATEDERNDWFVLATWAVTPDNDLLLLNVYREHAETVVHMKIMREQFDAWRPTYQGVEKATFGLNIIQAAAKAGLPIRPLPAETDKVARAQTMVARYELGTVYHPRQASWLSEWEEELAAFPNGKHDDQVDVAAYAGIELVRGLGLEDAVEVSVI